MFVLFCLCSVFHTDADRKCQRFSALQRDSLQAPQAAAHCSGEFEITPHKWPIQPVLCVCFNHVSFSHIQAVYCVCFNHTSLCFSGQNGGREETVGSSHKETHSGEPSRRYTAESAYSNWSTNICLNQWYCNKHDLLFRPGIPKRFHQPNPV